MVTLVEMFVNVLFVPSCLHSAVSLTRITEWRFMMITYYYHYYEYYLCVDMLNIFIGVAY